MILGHERRVGYFDRVISRGRLAHAYLLYGPERVGRHAIAFSIARALLCPNRAKKSQSIADAGDDCRACREIEVGTHPDVTVLGLGDTLVSKKEVRKEIPIEDIRELKRRFSFASVGDRWRIAIIDDADRMSTEAADAFLKLLEEPGARTLFFLIACSRDAVAPTIASRATPVGFSLVPDKTLLPFIRSRLPKENPEKILAIVQGRAGMVAEFAEHPERLREEEKLMAFFATAFKDGMLGALAMSEKAAEDEVMRDRAIRAFLAEFRRQLRSPASGEIRIHAAQTLSRALGIAAALEDTNVNPRLALDVMFAEDMTS